MALNILSIDMDYILEPCINLYNDLCILDNPQMVWDKINEVRSIDSHLSYSPEKLKIVIDIFTKAINKLNDKNNVMFALNHDAVLYELTKEKYINSKVNVYNIDHHHDINYVEQDIKNVDCYDYATVGTWVWYLDKYKIIEKYTWIKNSNSGIYPGPKLDAEFIEMTDIRDEDFNFFNFDFIFVSQSPQWLPRKYDYFWDILINIYENYTGNKVTIENNNFCPGNMSKKLNISL